MPSLATRVGFLAVAAAGTLLVAAALVEVPQLRLAGMTFPTQSVVGVVAGLLTLLSVPVAWRVDRWLRERITDP